MRSIILKFYIHNVKGKNKASETNKLYISIAKNSKEIMKLNLTIETKNKV